MTAALKQNIEMYKRLVREDPRNDYFRDWLDAARAELEKREASNGTSI